MDDYTLDATYLPPMLGIDVRAVINRAHLSTDNGGCYLTVSAAGLQWGDYVHLFWDGEFVSKGYVSAWTRNIDFPIAPVFLAAHPGMDQPGRPLEAFYVVQTYGAPSLDGMRRSPSLVFDAKTTLPGGGKLVPIEGTDGLTRRKDLVLTVPPWANMEKDARVTVYWRQKAISIDPAAVKPGQPLSVSVPWSLIDKAPQGVVAVSYEIEDRVGNRSGRAPAIDLAVDFADLLPMPMFQSAVNATGQVDTDLATRAAIGTAEPDTTAIVVEYPDPQYDDEIVLRVQGTMAGGIEIVPYELALFAATSTRHVFDLPIAWLTYLAGGRIFCSYTVLRDGVELKSAARERSVVGTLQLTSPPEVDQAPGEGALLDLNVVGEQITISVETYPIWQADQMTVILRVGTNDPAKGLERSAPMLMTDDDGFLVWTFSPEDFAGFPDGDLALTVILQDAEGRQGPASRQRRVVLRTRKPPLAWPSPTVDGVADGQLALDGLPGETIAVRLGTHTLFQAGDQVTLTVQGKTLTSNVESPTGSLMFLVPRAFVESLAGSSITLTYVVKRGNTVVGPDPVTPVVVQISPLSIGALPPPVVDGMASGTLDVEAAKGGTTLRWPAGADVRDGDKVVFSVKASSGEWREVPSSQGAPIAGRVDADDIIPSLGNTLSARYVVTRNGKAKVSEPLVLILKAYEKEDGRLPRPLIKEAQQKPGGKGNPYIDIKTVTSDVLTIVVPPWPFMRAGQFVTVAVSSADKSGGGGLVSFTLERLPVLASDLINGVCATIPVSWIRGNLPKVADTDLVLRAIIERPLATDNARFMALPSAVVNVVNLDEVDVTPPVPAVENALPTITVVNGRWIDVVYGMSVTGMTNPVMVQVGPWKTMAAGDKLTLVAESSVGEPPYVIVRDHVLNKMDIGSTLTFPLSRAWINRVINRRKGRTDPSSFVLKLSGPVARDQRVQLFDTRFYEPLPEDLIDTVPEANPQPVSGQVVNLVDYAEVTLHGDQAVGAPKSLSLFSSPGRISRGMVPAGMDNRYRFQPGASGALLNFDFNFVTRNRGRYRVTLYLGPEETGTVLPTLRCTLNGATKLFPFYRNEAGGYDFYASWSVGSPTPARLELIVLAPSKGVSSSLTIRSVTFSRVLYGPGEQ